MKKYAVFGLGISNLAVIKALGEQAIAWDDNKDARDKAEALGADIQLFTTDLLRECEALILSPGVPLHFPEPHKVVTMARDAGIEIICDIELFMRMHPDLKTIGITGTNGKSTTTALTAHILNEGGIKAIAAGNIGRPIFDVTDFDQVLVLELSSYQLDLCPTYRPDIAILLNVTPDHLDRHGTMEDYIAAKRRILDGADEKISMVSNEEAATRAARAMGLDDETIKAAIKTYKGLPHRQFHVRDIGQVAYINDSKATNGVATGNALQKFNNIYLIAGGDPKIGGLNGLEESWQNVRHVYLIGAAQEVFAKWLKEHGVAHTKCGDMDHALQAAHEAAQNNGEQATVLLSPACASFDQFKNFEKRGEYFEQLVNAL